MPHHLSTNMGGALFGGSQPAMTGVPMTPDSPTMMNVDQNPDDVSLQCRRRIRGGRVWSEGWGGRCG